MAERIECQRSDGGVAVDTHMPAEDNHRKTLVAHEFNGDVHRIGDNGQVGKTVKMTGYLKRRGAAVEHDVVAVLYECGGKSTDTLFLTEIEHPFLTDGGILVLILYGTADCPSAGAHQ